MSLSSSSNIVEIPGIGPKNSAEFAYLGINTVEDLIMTPASRFQRRNEIQNFSSVVDKGTVNTFCKLLSKGSSRNGILKLTVEDIKEDESKIIFPQTATIWCFGRNYLDRSLRVGSIYYVYGHATRSEEFGTLTISQFEIKKVDEYNGQYSAPGFGKILPVYSISNSALNTKFIMSIKRALASLDWDKEDFGITEEMQKKFQVFSPRDGFYNYHIPKDDASLEKGRRTLSLIELIKLRGPEVVRNKFVGEDNKKYRPGGFYNEISHDEKDFINSLPFRLTDSQVLALCDIFNDLERGSELTERLLQGEVASGKTICSFIAIYHEALRGNQSILMAPTQILAYQHYLNAKKFFDSNPFNFKAPNFVFLSSRIKKKEKEEIAEGLRSGEIDFIISTSSVLSSNFNFKSLSLVVIDEEQRFGVCQKEHFASITKNPLSVVYMSATPIPRSIVKIIYQNYEVSTLSRPTNVTNVKTFLVSQKKREEAYNCIKGELQRGKCAYFVVPRIDSEKEELKSIESLRAELEPIFEGIRGETITSRTKDEDKKRILDDFISGKVSYLISTSIVEVGLDNKKASCIVVEDADTFGLATLHQLRGRVGRDGEAAWCFLVYREDITENGKKRLLALHESYDGFYIAECDLMLRGGGDIVGGFNQSGKGSLKFFSIEKDKDFVV